MNIENVKKALRQKTEEVEKLKVEIDNLKELIRLKEEVEENKIEEIVVMSNMKKNGFKRISPQFEPLHKDIKCDVCGYKAVSKNQLDRHKESEHTTQEVKKTNENDKSENKNKSHRTLDAHKSEKHITYDMETSAEEEYNCLECDFQGTEKAQLEKHISWQHTIAKCDLCEFKGGNKRILEEHKTLKHITNSQDCNKCDTTYSCNTELQKHIEEKHVTDKRKDPIECENCALKEKTKTQIKDQKIRIHPSIENIKCRICGEKFDEKGAFMYHRKNKHIEMVAMCRNSAEGKCIYSSDKCYWKHMKESSDCPNIECYVCNETFPSKDSMMKHRKVKHANIVKDCNKELNDGCTLGDEKCWFKHNRKTNNSEEEQLLTQSDFQEVFPEIKNK